MSQELEKQLAEIVDKKIQEVIDGNEKNVQEFRVENETTFKEFKEGFEKELKKLSDKNSEEFKELAEEVKQMQEEYKSKITTDVAVGFKSAFIAITSTDEFKAKLMESKETNKDFKVDIYEVLKAFKNGEEKGLNVYGEASENGVTDTNVFGATTPDQALDALWAFLNADQVARIELDTPFIFPYVSVTQTNKPVFTYSEIVPKIPVNTYAGYKVVKEGGLKPTQDLAISTTKTKAIKLAKGMIYTLEVEDDIPDWTTMIRTLLAQEFALAQQDAIMKYVDPSNATAQNNGILNNNVGFDATKVMAKVQAPTLIDVIKAISAQVSTTRKYNYGLPGKATVAVINPLTYEYEIGMLKDTQNRQLVETDFRKRMREEYGIEIVLREEIPVGKILEGDLKKFQVKPYKPFSIRLAWIDDLAIHNQTLTIAEGRHIQFLPLLDKAFIVYADIAVIKTALAAGPTPAP
ncbi:hypothetical protein NV63_06855 [Elizabethkingia anophelis]|nr:hypothetical protein NV63_06855 [Elizabethkingia anophelis]MCT4330952.1 hypothetical protein [Elizabethkingia anophelis]